MPMLRPPELVSPGESGTVMAIRSMGIIEVRFRRGRFLISEEKLDLH